MTVYDPARIASLEAHIARIARDAIREASRLIREGGTDEEHRRARFAAAAGHYRIATALLDALDGENKEAS